MDDSVSKRVDREIEGQNDSTNDTADFSNIEASKSDIVEGSGISIGTNTQEGMMQGEP